MENQCPGFLLGPGHIGTLCLVCTKVPDAQKESKCSAKNKPHYLYSLRRESLLSVREWWEHFQNPGSQAPGKGLALQAGLSKDGN